MASCQCLRAATPGHGRRRSGRRRTVGAGAPTSCAARLDRVIVVRSARSAREPAACGRHRPHQGGTPWRSGWASVAPVLPAPAAGNWASIPASRPSYILPCFTEADVAPAASGSRCRSRWPGRALLAGQSMRSTHPGPRPHAGARTGAGWLLTPPRNVTATPGPGRERSGVRERPASPPADDRVAGDVTA